MSKDKGVIRLKSVMDRESDFVRDNKYTALIGAYDNGKCEARISLVFLDLTTALGPKT